MQSTAAADVTQTINIKNPSGKGGREGREQAMNKAKVKWARRSVCWMVYSRYISRTQLRQFVDVRQNSSDWNNYNKYLFIILFIQDIEFFNFVMLSCLIFVHSVAVVALLGILHRLLNRIHKKHILYIEFKWTHRRAASTLPGLHYVYSESSNNEKEFDSTDFGIPLQFKLML